MTNKILETVIANGELKRIANDLGLNEIPTIEYVYTDKSYVMAAGGTVWTSGSLFSIRRTITKTEAIYKISVNYKALRGAQLSYALMTLNPRAAYDITVILLRHECRHLWQYQGDFFVGKTEEPFKSPFEAHGVAPEEIDANEYAIRASKNRRVRAAAKFSKEEQNQGFFNQHFGVSKEFRNAAKDMIAAYNPILSIVLKAITR